MKENKVWEQAYLEKCLFPANLKVKLAALRKEKKSIATLNGCFDLLHVGHLHMFYEASKFADILIVALNSDSSIKKYKGEDRPIHPLNERMQMVGALGFVDYVTFFEEATPNDLLEIIRPDVHVNSVEYGKDCIEAPIVTKYGGRIELVSFVEGFSTTKTLAKIAKSEGQSHATSC